MICASWFRLCYRNRRVKNYLADSFKTREISLLTRSSWRQKGDKGLWKKAGSSPWSVREEAIWTSRITFHNVGSCSPLWGYTSLRVILEFIVLKSTENPLGYKFSSKAPLCPLSDWVLSSTVFTLLLNGSI